jgi:rhodanese-related sulfurtransferase
VFGFSRTPSLDAATTADMLAARRATLVDVRQHGEWKKGHIHGSLHIPLAQLAGRLHQLPQGSTIVTVCQSGHRSAVAARTLIRAGHDVHNLRGGINAWARAGLPLSTGGGRRR